MSGINRALHYVTKRSAVYQHGRFLGATQNVEQVQRKRLRRILAQSSKAQASLNRGLSARMSPNSFAAACPVTNYSDWRDWIELNMAGDTGLLTHSNLVRYQPTSGSTSNIKWIPYSAEFLSEMNRALMAWMGDMYLSVPSIAQGHHYWSVSWLPTEQRTELNGNINDDLTLLPLWKRMLARYYMAVPESISLAKTSDDSLFATLAWLISCRDLTFLSVWSPTFALAMFSEIPRLKDELIMVLSKGKWLDRSETLKTIPCPRSDAAAWHLGQMGSISDSEALPSLWPNLALISSWDTASSAQWAAKLKECFPHSKFQGKGLWATEGVVTIPMGDQYPLAVDSHYYEFLDLNSKQVVPCWELNKGMEVSPIITTGSGLLRYKINDSLVVDGFLNQCPTLSFTGRLDGTDLAGEKISNQAALDIQLALKSKFDVTSICVLAIPGNKLSELSGSYEKGCYVLLCAPNRSVSRSVLKIEEEFERFLCNSFHYKLARDLNQLSRARVVITPNAMEIYFERCRARGMAEGNVKIEPLVLWDCPLPRILLTHLSNAISAHRMS